MEREQIFVIAHYHCRNCHKDFREPHNQPSHSISAGALDLRNHHTLVTHDCDDTTVGIADLIKVTRNPNAIWWQGKD